MVKSDLANEFKRYYKEKIFDWEHYKIDPSFDDERYTTTLKKVYEYGKSLGISREDAIDLLEEVHQEFQLHLQEFRRFVYDLIHDNKSRDMTKEEVKDLVISIMNDSQIEFDISDDEVVTYFTQLFEDEKSNLELRLIWDSWKALL